MTPSLVDHVLVLCITVLLPVHDLLFWYPRLVRAAPERRARVRGQAYMESMLIEWGLFAAVAGWWFTRGREWAVLGFGLPLGWGFWAGLGVAVGVFVFGTRQRLQLTRNPDRETEQAVMAQLENLRPLLPHTRPEMTRFSMVSITAGVCEETLFRGFLIWYLDLLVPTVAALLVGALLFGMAHAYQGARGILQTGLVGLGLVVLYVMTGSLWIPIVVHAFVDLNSGLLAYAFLRRDREHLRVSPGPDS